MANTRLREEKQEALRAVFPTTKRMDEFVEARNKFFLNNKILVTRVANECTVYFSAEDYRKVPFVNFEVLSSDLKKVVGHDNVCWTTR